MYKNFDLLSFSSEVLGASKKRPLNVMKTRMSKGYRPIEISTVRITANGHHGPSPPGLSGMNPKNSTVVETRIAEAPGATSVLN